MSKIEDVNNIDLDNEGEFIQVKKKSDKNQDSKTDKRKTKARSRNNSVGEGKTSNKPRSRNSSSNAGRVNKIDNRSKPGRGKNVRKGGKIGRNYEDEEWRTVYIGFIERGTSSEELANVFKVLDPKLLICHPIFNF